MLSIGGSDPSSGAGIQGDIRVAQQLDCYCLTAVTAITSQNSSEYQLTVPLSPKTVLSQVESVISDFEIDVIKIGMVYDTKIIAALYKRLRTVTIPIVVDPVIRSTTGGVLLRDDALTEFRKKIVPIAFMITPNVAESEAISAMRMSVYDPKEIASKIIKMGAQNVVITGIYSGQNVIDYVKSGLEKQELVSKKIMAENHGGGCTFSSALAISIAGGDNVFKAARFANRFARRSIVDARRIGDGLKIADQKTNVLWELKKGVSGFAQIEGICKAIPECQTNFVFAKNRPKNTDDVAGVIGRIVRAGNDIIVAGEIGFGGSRHVATAVLEVNKKFPRIRSAVNMRYNEEILNRMRLKKLKVLSYDRKKEPVSVKAKEGLSVSWGTRRAISRVRSAPDVIFHMGDVGKEPMILVFAETPQKLIYKIRDFFRS